MTSFQAARLDSVKCFRSGQFIVIIYYYPFPVGVFINRHLISLRLFELHDHFDLFRNHMSLAFIDHILNELQCVSEILGISRRADGHFWVWTTIPGAFDQPDPGWVQVGFRPFRAGAL